MTRWAFGASGRERRRLDGHRAAVLMYHRILPRDRASLESVEPGMYVEPETFRRHMGWLNAFFRVLPLHEIVTRLAEDKPLPDGACAVTFDDGWRDNLEFGLPVLEEFSLPATLFAVSGRVGTAGGFWSDEVVRRLSRLEKIERSVLARDLELGGSGDSVDAFLAAFKGVPEVDRLLKLDQLRERTEDSPASIRSLLDWEELERLSRSGVDIEAHGASHAILTGLATEDVRQELRDCLEALRQHGHARHRLLAYPSGAYDASIVEIARDCGYAGAVTTVPGLASPSSDSLLLPRIGLHDDISRSRSEFLRWVPGAHSDLRQADS